MSDHASPTFQAREERRRVGWRTRERYNRRRLEVLKAAARTFNTKGYQLATLDDVAHELGVTKPALYHYARSKDELLFECCHTAFSATRAAFDRSNNHTSGLERLGRFFRCYGEIVCEDFGRCLTSVVPQDFAVETRSRVLAEHAKLRDGVRAMIVGGIDDGSIRCCDDHALTVAMLDAFNGLARWHDSKGPTPLRAAIDQYLSVFLTGITAISCRDSGCLTGRAQGRTGASLRVEQIPRFKPPTRRDEPLFVIRLRG